MNRDDTPTDAPRRDRNAEKRAKSAAARLYAVQALFQMEAAGTSADRVQFEFRKFRIGAEHDGEVSPEADESLFTRIVDDAVTWQGRIDQATDQALVERWPIDRIDPVLRALFRAAGAELIAPRTPPRVVISEYVGLSDAFFPEGRESKFVNAVLDHMARALRPDDMG